MSQDDEVYLSILTADYDEASKNFEVDVAYSASLPRNVYSCLDDSNPISGLIRDLQEGTGRTSFQRYFSPVHLAIDETLSEGRSGGRERHWFSVLEDMGYSGFIEELRYVADKEGEAYLLVSFEDLGKSAVEQETKNHLTNLQQQLNQRKSKESTFTYRMF